MAGLLAIFGSFLAFVVPLAIPLFVQRWRTLALVVGAAVVFFGWLTWDLARPDNGNWIGPFFGGLMLFGFAGGVIAKFVMLVGQSRR